MEPKEVKFGEIDLKNLFEFLRRVKVSGDEAHILVGLQQRIALALHPERAPKPPEEKKEETPADAGGEGGEK